MTDRQAHDLAVWICLPSAFILAWTACGMRMAFGLMPRQIEPDELASALLP